MEQIMMVVNEALVNVILAVVALAGTYAVMHVRNLSTKLKAETFKIEDEHHRGVTKEALERLEDVAVKTVTKIEETSAKKIRKAVADGEVDRKELEDLAEEAYHEIMWTLGRDYMEVIEESIGDFRTYILIEIECALKKVKAEN